MKQNNLLTNKTNECFCNLFKTIKDVLIEKKYEICWNINIDSKVDDE